MHTNLIPAVKSLLNTSYRNSVTKLQSITAPALAFIYPPNCALCQSIMPSSGSLLCSECTDKIPWFDAAHCRYCGNSIRDTEQCDCGTDVSDRSFNDIWTATAFDESVQNLIHQLKYQRRRRIGIYFGRFIGKMIEKETWFTDINVLIPVPLFSTRKRERGYNQSECIVQGISAITQLPYHTDLLKRVRNTESQTTLSLEERAKNVQDVFEVSNPLLVNGKHIAIVDDVMTTGATLESCAGTLMDAGAATVYAIAVARA